MGGGYGPPGFSAPPPPPHPPKDTGTSGAVIALVVLVVLAVLGIGGCLICLGVGALGSSKPPTPPKSTATATVYVLCDGSPAGGFSCTVTHTSGTAKADACWDIRVSCHNGTLVSGRSCQVVAPQGKATRFVRSADLSNVNRCNGAASTAVENVTVRVVD
jgi:hypothetical protein